MDKLSETQEEKLLEYIDGTLSTREKEIFEEVLKNSPILQSRFEEINLLDSNLRALKVIEPPSKNFTQQVMSKLDQSPLGSKLLFRNGIVLLIGVLVAVGICSVLLTTGVFDGTSTIDLNQALIPNKYFQKSLPTISFNGKMIVNAIILLNLALAFMILDKAVLKPWFERKTRMYL